MVANYYTLLHLARQLDSDLKNFGFAEAWTQEAHLCSIRFYHGKEEHVLVVSSSPRDPYLFLTKGYNRAKSNTVDLFVSLAGGFVDGVSIHPADREIRILFTVPGNLGRPSSRTLLLQFFGSKSNVLLVDEGGTILDSFLKPRELAGTRYIEPSRKEFPGDWSLADALQTLLEHRTATCRQALKILYPQLDPVLIAEVLFRADQDGERPVHQLLPDEVSGLIQQGETLLRELTGTCAPRIYYNEERPAAFSVIPLRSFFGLKERTFETLHAAIRIFTRASSSTRITDSLASVILKQLQLRMERSRRTLAKVRSEQGDARRAEEYERKGKLLLAHLFLTQKGMHEATIPDIFEPGSPDIVIELEPSLSPQKNAERYFAKSKKSLTALYEKKEKIAALEEELHLLDTLYAEAQDAQSEEQVIAFVERRRAVFKKLAIQIPGKKRETKEQVPFKIFVVIGGFEVWAGKSSANNDLLTMKYAKPNDLWFHARGSAGSHVVLRRGSAKGDPSKRAIEQAASIAAYYSKMKNARHVPVIVCEKKYVRKPKGASPGTVTVEREKLLFVDPALPQPQEEKTL